MTLDEWIGEPTWVGIVKIMAVIVLALCAAVLVVEFFSIVVFWLWHVMMNVLANGHP